MTTKELTADDILNAADPDAERYQLLGGYVLVRGMTPDEHDRFDSDNFKSRKDGRIQGYRGRLLAFCVIDETTGEPKFTADQAEKLGKKRGAHLERLVDVALRLSGLNAQAAEDLRGNSEAGRSA